MVKFILLIFTIMTGVSTKEQVQIIPDVDTSFYYGIDNGVTLKSQNIPLTQLSLQSDSGTITGKDGYYRIRYSGKQSNAILKVVYKNEVIASKTININSIADPIAYAAGDSIFNHGYITKTQSGRLQLLIAKSNFPLIKWTVNSFTFTMLHNQTIKGYQDNKSNVFSLQIISYLKKAETGDEIIFDNIRIIEGTDPRQKAIPTIKLKVI